MVRVLFVKERVSVKLSLGRRVSGVVLGREVVVEMCVRLTNYVPAAWWGGSAEGWT